MQSTHTYSTYVLWCVSLKHHGQGYLEYSIQYILWQSWALSSAPARGDIYDLPVPARAWADPRVLVQSSLEERCWNMKKQSPHEAFAIWASHLGCDVPFSDVSAHAHARYRYRYPLGRRKLAMVGCEILLLLFAFASRGRAQLSRRKKYEEMHVRTTWRRPRGYESSGRRAKGFPTRVETVPTPKPTK